MKRNSNLTPKQKGKRWKMSIAMALYVAVFQFYIVNMDWIIKHIPSAAMWFVLPTGIGLFFYFWCDWSME